MCPTLSMLAIYLPNVELAKLYELAYYVIISEYQLFFVSLLFVAAINPYFSNSKFLL